MLSIYYKCIICIYIFIYTNNRYGPKYDIPLESMYDIFTYISLENQPNVSVYI